MSDAARAPGPREARSARVLLAHFLGAARAPQSSSLRLSGGPAARTGRTICSVPSSCAPASAQPVVVVVENVHWIDASSGGVPALTWSARAAGSSAPARPHDADRRGPVAGCLAARRRRSSVEGARCRRDVRAMMRRCLGVDRVAEPLLELLVDKGEGNPLYVEEILRQLQETGGLVVEDGEARLRERRRHGARHHPRHHRRPRRPPGRSRSSRRCRSQRSSAGRFGVSLLSRVLESRRDAVSRRPARAPRLDFVFPSAPIPSSCTASSTR